MKKVWLFFIFDVNFFELCRYMKKWVSGDHKKIIQIACIFLSKIV